MGSAVEPAASILPVGCPIVPGSRLPLPLTELNSDFKHDITIYII